MEENSLFETNQDTHEPLAARMRPCTLDEYIGQDHIIGKGRLLRRAISADQLSSVIFYGPPGSGKTTLARVIANHTKSNFITLNAVLTGVADIRKAISEAEQQHNLYNKKTILFVDEVHRWNKSQQDALLPWVENGTIILIGATTENPFFEVNKALVSRSRVFQLKPLTKDDLMKAAMQTLNNVERGYGHWKVTFEPGALEHLVDTANGDARSLLNALELAVETTPEKWNPTANPPVPSYGSTIYISRETAEESIQKKVVLYDKDGDYHYDIISAFIKSLRGRDPDAACYWLARMVKAGEDPHFIFRRMMISACEDTGLADPNAISIVESCAAAFDRVGFPEGNYFLAHAALYLSTAPKSNSSMAFFDALGAVEKEDVDVPNHLKDNNRDAEGFGHGAGYLYPHAYRDHWVAQQYLPDALTGRVFYTPSDQGYEKTIRDSVLSRRELQIAALLENANSDESAKKNLQVNPISDWWKQAGHFSGFVKKEENLTYSPEDKQKNSAISNAERSWRNRLDSNKAQTLLLIRNTMISSAELLRHHRCLIWNADDALLIFEVLRKTPEGHTCGLFKNKTGLELIEQYSKTLGSIDKPTLCTMTTNTSSRNSLDAENFRQSLYSFNDIIFDRIFFRDICASKEDINQLAANLKDAFYNKDKTDKDIAFSEDEKLHKTQQAAFDKNAIIIISQRIPKHGQRLSKLIREQLLKNDTDIQMSQLLDKMETSENEFFNNSTNPLFAWDENTLKNTLSSFGFDVSIGMKTIQEKRIISPVEISRWFSQESAYGQYISKAVGQEGIQTILKTFETLSKEKVLTWNTENAFITCRLAQSSIE